MFIVGLTGGIASGKSTVARLFQALGASLIDADEIAREVVMPGQPTLGRLVAVFGEDILDAEGQLNRQRLRQMAFGDPALRRRLDAIMHPAIGLRMQECLRQAEGPYVILMVPLLVETGQHRLVNRVLVVDAPEEMQIERLMDRDGVSREQACQALAAQSDRAQRLAAADDILHNTASPEDLVEPVRRLHQAYLQMADKRQGQGARFEPPAQS